MPGQAREFGPTGCGVSSRDAGQNGNMADDSVSGPIQRHDRRGTEKGKKLERELMPVDVETVYVPHTIASF
jgi:hypothetical protein